MICEKFLCISSSTNIVPDIGAENAPASPALAPALIRARCSLISLLKNFEIALPLQAPSCIERPSLPSDNPPIAARDPPIYFATMVFFSSILNLPINSPCT